MSKAVPAHRGRHSHLGGAGVGIGQDVVRTVDEVGVLPLGHEEVDDGHCLSVHPASPSSTPPTETEDPQVDLRMEHAVKTAR